MQIVMLLLKCIKHTANLVNLMIQILKEKNIDFKILSFYRCQVSLKQEPAKERSSQLKINRDR